MKKKRMKKKLKKRLKKILLVEKSFLDCFDGFAGFSEAPLSNIAAASKKNKKEKKYI